MIYRIPALLSILSLLFGCAITTEPTPINYNPETDETPIIDPLTGNAVEYQPTPDYVIARDEKGIIIEVIKNRSYYDEQYETEIQSWSVFAINTTNREKCVGVIWRLLDFKFISEHPTTFLVPRNSEIFIGSMQGQTMKISGVQVAVPPSGYVHEMQVLYPDWKAEEGFECMFLTKDDEVIDETNHNVLDR